MCLTESAVFVGAILHGETYGKPLRRQQAADTPCAMTAPLPYQAYGNCMAWSLGNQHRNAALNRELSHAFKVGRHMI